MKFSKLSTTLTVMALLIVSGISIPVVSANGGSNGNGGSQTFPAASPTFTGSASHFLLGPITVSASAVNSNKGPALTTTVTQSQSELTYESHALDGDPKPYLPTQDPYSVSSSIPPTVNCGFSSSTGNLACSSVSLGSGGATTQPYGINAYDSAPFTVEPPDQGLCVGGGLVMELLNQGEIQIFNARTLAPVSGVIYLDNLMGLNTFPNGGWSSGGDIMCQYDSANGGHWFITQIVSASNESSGGPFSGCFAALQDACYEGIAVSSTSNPTGAYHVYFVATDKANTDPGSDATPDAYGYAGVLLNDFAKSALTRDAFLMFYDEFDLVSGGFNGAQEFAFSKSALESGAASINVAYEDMGTASNLSPIPTNGAYQPELLPGTAWYEVIPTQVTDPSQYDNANGGTGLMVATLDFIGAGDNRVAVFDWTGLSSLGSPGCSGCGQIQFGGTLLKGVVTYQDEGSPCLAEDYATVSSFCGLGAQKAGPTPLGVNCSLLEDGEPTTGCPEGGIASNGDGATQAFYSDGTIWTAVSTIVNQTFGYGEWETHLGATYWGISVGNSFGNTNAQSNLNNHGSIFSIQSQGYVSAAHEDIEFPAMASGGGEVLMSFTLSGTGGPNGGFYPSSAYAILQGGGDGFGPSTIHVTALGQSPTDGFTEYQFYGTALSYLYRPRWGDYGQAVFDATTGRFYFASEYIQHPNCSPSSWLSDPTCGGTRAPFANWGSSISYLATQEF